MAEDTPSEGDLPVDPLFGDWLNGSPAKGARGTGAPDAEGSRFMDAVLGSSGDSTAAHSAPESTPFSEAVFGGAAQSGHPDEGVDAPHPQVDSPFGAAVIGDRSVGQRRLTRPVAMAGIVTLVGVGWLGVWTGISPGARHDLGDVVRALPGGSKIVPASQQESTTHDSVPVAAGTPSAPGGGAASPSVAGLNIGSILQPALFQAGAVSSTSAKRTIARHAPTPDTVSSPGHGGITVPGGGVPSPKPPVVSTGSPGPTRPGGWGGNGRPTGGPTTDPTTDSPSPTDSTTTEPGPTGTTTEPGPTGTTTEPGPTETTTEPGPVVTTTEPGPTETTTEPGPVETTTEPGSTETTEPGDGDSSSVTDTPSAGTT